MMQITKARFCKPVHVYPGNIFHVIHSSPTYKKIFTSFKIKQEQIFDHIQVVDYGDGIIELLLEEA